MRSLRALLHAMRTRRTHRIGPAEAERLLAGDRPGPEHTALRDLLDAACAPATAQELAGEEAAVAAFAAHRKRAARTARRTAARRALVPVTSAVALLAIGGTAFAARTGNLPQEAQQHAHRLFSALGVPAPRTGPTSRPAPGITALTWCDAWSGGTPLNSADRQRLVEAAGGEKAVGRYCADLRASASVSPGPRGSRPQMTPSGPGSGSAPRGLTPSNAPPPTAGQVSPSPHPSPPEIEVTRRDPGRS